MHTKDKRRTQALAANTKAVALLAAIYAAGVFTGHATAPVAQERALEPRTVTAVPWALPDPAALLAAPERQEEAQEVEYIGTFRATAYCPCVQCCGVWSAEHPTRGEDYIQRTSSGTIPTQGRTIAADWDVLPCGSEVILNGHTYTVEDTGGAIKGNRIDIYFDSHQEALEWGIREVELYRVAGK